MTDHKELLDCGHPNLAHSVRSWLNENDFENVNLDHLSEPEEKREFPGLSQGWDCERKRVYQALDYPREDFEWSAKFKFDQGNYLEAYVMHALKEVWDLTDHVHSESGQMTVELDLAGHTLEGHPDGVLDYGPNKYIVECKSMDQNQFNARWNDTSVVKMINPDGVLAFDPANEEHWDWWGKYIAQTFAYAKATGIPNILYIFKGRNKGIASAYQEFDEQIWTEVEDRWRTVLSAVDAEELPARPIDVQELRASNKNIWKGTDSFPCGYCAWFKQCHDDLNPEKEIDPVTGKAHLIMDNGGRK